MHKIIETYAGNNTLQQLEICSIIILVQLSSITRVLLVAEALHAAPDNRSDVSLVQKHYTLLPTIAAMFPLLQKHYTLLPKTADTFPLL
jgi:hypothetical protein